LNFSTSRSELDLAARRAIARIEGHDPDDATVAEYTVFGSEKYNMMVEGVRKELNLTSLRFQKLESLIEAIGLPREQICTYCWTGTEPETKD
jgi:amidophosphoribosyltransferase